jgi:hypothetical protein
MRRLLILALSLGFILSLVMSSKALADDHLNYGPEALPFFMSSYEVVTAEVPTAECASALYQVLVEGTGTATQMGAVTVTRSHCFSPFQNPPISGGYWEARAADGDMIWGSYTGTLVPTAFDSDGNPIRGIITSPYTVDGGTGRFANAGGQGVSVGDYDLVANEGDFDTSGTLSR